ncbi:TIGR04211 family SH3 domain-containing protein [Aeromonas simiae]|uniref:TIGR04211 family SH3 domain-containing protein n=1 Tax=Aeromonas simiae TaxID=218936 RepID=A0A5J6X1I3_9GAMM|nr:TIGR04211 family SH3 domain-containing protein [Aeromonas simiae]QFI55923.1 TIGR04211 family SH3 domain-containing protein [Aeromonas simiae]
MRALIGILLALLANQAMAETRYVSDNIYTFIHGGPGTQFRILGSVKAGEPVELQGGSEAGFVQIKDSKGRAGWVKNDDLQTAPSYRQQLPELQKQLDELKGRLQNLNGDNERQFAEKDAAIAEQKKQLAALQSQLQAQTEQVTSLKEQNDALNQSYDNREHDMQMDWFVRGGLMVGAGLLLGLMLPMLPKRRRRDRWMD